MKRGINIRFSEEELRCMNDTGFLFTKRAVTDKLYHLFHKLAEVLKSSPAHRHFVFPAGTDFQTGKISRGENYKGLPYVMLDFPRLFEKDNVFAFRTMFWWGNYFSFTLHLKGGPLRLFRKALLRHIAAMKNNDLLIYTGDDEWEHDLSDKHYAKPGSGTVKTLRRRNFIKLCRKVKLQDYPRLFEKGIDTYELFLGLLSR